MNEIVNYTSPVAADKDCISGNGEILLEESAAKDKLKSWLNRYLRIKMTDGRVLTGAFLCTDRNANVILGSCEEHLSDQRTEPRALGLVMVPGRHIVTIHINSWSVEEASSSKQRCSSPVG